jgi:hypothetical protein
VLNQMAAIASGGRSLNDAYGASGAVPAARPKGPLRVHKGVLRPNARQRARCADSGRSRDRHRTGRFDPKRSFASIDSNAGPCAEADLESSAEMAVPLRLSQPAQPAGVSTTAGDSDYHLGAQAPSHLSNAQKVSILAANPPGIWRNSA